jgi:hypothetical protein
MTAQQTSSSAQSVVVPRLVNFSGNATDTQGKTISGVAGATFAIYRDQYEGSPLWLETQNVQADAKGNYTAQLGATKADGLPLDLFTSGEARWLGVTINGGQEQPRVLLLSVPYALKAADAETVGGLPASAFALASKQVAGPNAGATLAASSPKTGAPAANPAVTGSGVADFIPMWDATSDIVDSILFQKSLQIGVNTTAPAATLDVNGKSDVRDTLTLFPKGTDPTVAISGTTFKVDQTGKVSFVSGQKFPGTGTVTSVGLSAPTSDFKVTGSPVKTSGTLALNWNVAPTPNNTANAIVKRDALGSFTATNATITGRLAAQALSGNGNAISGSSSVSNATVIYGGANSATGATWAVEGENFSNDPGAYGVIGRSHSAGIGVVGLNDASGVAVMGSAPGGLGFSTDSNVQQARTMGGWVKAMVFFNYANASPIVSCFNSTLTGAAATTPPCGFNYEIASGGDYVIDFGFQVDDRFLTATDVYNSYIATVCTDSVGTACNFIKPPNLTSVEVTTFGPDIAGTFNVFNSSFFLIVY